MEWSASMFEGPIEPNKPDHNPPVGAGVGSWRGCVSRLVASPSVANAISVQIAQRELTISVASNLVVYEGAHRRPATRSPEWAL
jgi:hypothetical protein